MEVERTARLLCTCVGDVRPDLSALVQMITMFASHPQKCSECHYRDARAIMARDGLKTDLCFRCIRNSCYSLVDSTDICQAAAEGAYVTYNANVTNIIQNLPFIILDDADDAALARMAAAPNLRTEELVVISDQLHDIGCLGSAAMLRKVDASHCDLTTIDGIERSPMLEVLDVSRSKQLRDISCLRNAAMLRKVDASYCGLTAIVGLERAPMLEEIMLCYNKHLRDIGCLGMARMLRKLDVSGCTVETIVGIERAPMLEELNLSRNCQLRDISCLVNAPMLRKVVASRCRLTSLVGLEKLQVEF